MYIWICMNKTRYTRSGKVCHGLQNDFHTIVVRFQVRSSTVCNGLVWLYTTFTGHLQGLHTVQLHTIYIRYWYGWAHSWGGLHVPLYIRPRTVSHGHVRSVIRLFTDMAPVSVFFKSFKYHTRLSLIHSNSPSVTRIRPRFVRWYVLLDFINLTQVHNFTVSAQDFFTFLWLSVFTVRFTGILQVLMQIMKRFVPPYLIVKWLWYRVYNQKVVTSSPRVFFFFYLYSIRLISFIIDVPRPLRNEILDHSISKGGSQRVKWASQSQTSSEIHVKILFHNIAKTYGWKLFTKHYVWT